MSPNYYKWYALVYCKHFTQPNYNHWQDLEICNLNAIKWHKVENSNLREILHAWLGFEITVMSMLSIPEKQSN